MMPKAQALAAAPEPAAFRAMWSALDAATTPLATLLMLAALVRTLSASDYGILVIALAASGLSMAINPAIAATTTKFVSDLCGRPTPGNRTVAGVVTISLIMVAAIDLALLLATALFKDPLIRWMFGASVAGTRNLGPVLLLAVLAIGLQQLETVLSAAIRGMERFRRQAVIEMLSRAVLIAVVTLVAWRTRSLELILFAQCAVYLASMLVRAEALRRLLPDGRLFDLSGNAQSDALFRYGGWMWLAALAGVAYTSADRIIVGRSMGPASAGQYNVYVQITQLIHFIPNSIFAFSFPTFSRLAAQGNDQRDGIGRAYRTYFVAIGVVALALAAAMMLFWPFVLKIVAGMGTADGRMGAPGLLMLNFLLLACNVAPYYLLLALGHARVVSAVTTTSMLAALMLMVFLIPRYGLEGAALSRLAYGVGTLLLLHRAHRALRPA